MFRSPPLGACGGAGLFEPHRSFLFKLDAVARKRRRHDALQIGNGYVVVGLRLQFADLRHRELVLALQDEVGGLQTGGEFFLLAVELLPGKFSRSLRRVNAHLRRLYRLDCVPDFDFDSLHQLSRLQIYLPILFEELTKVGLRSAVAQRQAYLDAYAPGAELILEKVAERRSIATCKLIIYLRHPRERRSGVERDSLNRRNEITRGIPHRHN
jgi:hypothetical protein